jgi:glutathione peroxidase-family protein
MGLEAKSAELLLCIQENQSRNPFPETNYHDRFVTAKSQASAIAYLRFSITCNIEQHRLVSGQHSSPIFKISQPKKSKKTMPNNNPEE